MMNHQMTKREAALELLFARVRAVIDPINQRRKSRAEELYSRAHKFAVSRCRIRLLGTPRIEIADDIRRAHERGEDMLAYRVSLVCSDTVGASLLDLSERIQLTPEIGVALNACRPIIASPSSREVREVVARMALLKDSEIAGAVERLAAALTDRLLEVRR